MSDSDNDPGENAMFWFNLVGISLAAALFGSFFWFYGAKFFSLLILLFGPQPNWPDR